MLSDGRSWPAFSVRNTPRPASESQERVLRGNLPGIEAVFLLPSRNPNPRADPRLRPAAWSFDSAPSEFLSRASGPPRYSRHRYFEFRARLPVSGLLYLS